MFEFRKIKESDLDLVLRWRTSPDVTRWMLTDLEPDPQKHKEWFDRLDKKSYWVIHYEGEPIGVINLCNGERLTWGYYLGEKQGLGGLIPPYLYNHVFSNPLNRRIIAQVLEGNPIIRMHTFHGYEHKHTYKKLIKKYDTLHDVYELVLNRRKWIADKRFSHYKAVFE